MVSRDLSDNDLNGSVPDAILHKKQSGSLTLRYFRIMNLFVISGTVSYFKQLHMTALCLLLCLLSSCRILGNQQLCSSGACDEIRRKNSKGFIVGLSVSAASVVFFLLLASSIIFVKIKNGEAARKYPVLEICFSAMYCECCVNVFYGILMHVRNGREEYRSPSFHVLGG